MRSGTSLLPRAWLAAATASVLVAATARAEEQAAEPFDQFTFGLSLVVGSGSLNVAGQSNSYIVVGAGAAFYVLDGLKIEMGYEQWLGDEPLVSKITPGVRYVFWFVPFLKPYVGAFYRHWFFTNNFVDRDTVGGMAGGYFVMSKRFYFGIGAVYEGTVSECTGDCSVIYPEVQLVLSF